MQIRKELLGKVEEFREELERIKFQRGFSYNYMAEKMGVSLSSLRSFMIVGKKFRDKNLYKAKIFVDTMKAFR